MQDLPAQPFAALVLPVKEQGVAAAFKQRNTFTATHVVLEQYCRQICPKVTIYSMIPFVDVLHI